MNDIEILLLEIAGGLVLLDYISGFAKAVYLRSVSSSKMRDGLFHKFAYVLIVALSILLEYAQTKANLGINPPLVGIVSGYIIWIEGVSFAENVSALNLQIAKTKAIRVLLSVLACVKTYVDGQLDDAINTGKHAAATEADAELDVRGKILDDTTTENK